MIESLGGKCLKMETNYHSGIPDRLCLLPGNRMFFAEVKTTGEKPTKLQKMVGAELGSLGFWAVIVECSKDIDRLRGMIELDRDGKI